MFKVGDKIIFAAMGNSVMQYQQCLEMFISQGLIRHATPEEIAVGHRIESSNDQAMSDCSFSNLCQNDTQNSLSIKQENQDMGDDSHIENHISMSIVTGKQIGRAHV